MELRPYQTKALQALFDYWRSGGGNPLLAKATGTGKSVVIAFLIRQLLTDYPEMRVLVTAPNRELIDQDVTELREVWPDAPIGINCEGLDPATPKRKFCLPLSIRSIATRKRSGRGKLIIIDEAHLIPHRDQGMYRAMITALRELIPDLRVVGLTATPYRLDGGHLCEGEGHLFDSVVYEYSIAQGIRDGFLSPLSSKATQTTYRRQRCWQAQWRIYYRAARGGCQQARCRQRRLRRDRQACRRQRAWLVFCVGVDACRAGARRTACPRHQVPKWYWAKRMTMNAIASLRISRRPTDLHRLA